MTAEVVKLITREIDAELRVEPKAVLEAAQGRLETVVVAGIDANGKLYLAASDGAEKAYFIMERAKHYLLSQAEPNRA
jgi:hypothetical protein